MISFKHEERQYGRRRVDIAVKPTATIILKAQRFTIYDPILVIECKRLPTIPNNRMKEYVTGFPETSGGIQRFKLGLHGAKHDLVGMIGYIQKQTPQHWHREINTWIHDLASCTDADCCAWHTDETLASLEEHTIARTATCCSIHQRKDDASPITIRHLWVIMTPASVEA